MEGSANRLKAARLAVASALLAGAVAVVGCGGGGGSKSAVPPPPAGTPGANGGAVAATGTQGLIGPERLRP